MDYFIRRLHNFLLLAQNMDQGSIYKENFGIDYIKNRFNKLKFTLNYINFDVIHTKKFYRIDPRPVFFKTVRKGC